MKNQIGNCLLITSGILVHGCNAQGVMGSGIAKEIKDKYPEVYQDYITQYRHPSGLSLGDVVWSAPNEIRPFWIASAITQKFYGRNPKVRYVSYEAIDVVFSKIYDKAKKEELSVHYPKIGAGLGGGDWNIIQQKIQSQLKDINHTLWEKPKVLSKKHKI